MLIRSALQLAVVVVVTAGPLSRLLVAQDQPTALPVSATFEVVSVKKSVDPSLQIGARMMSGGRLSAVFTVRTLVQLAYGYPDTLTNAQVVGGPSWIDTDRFDINATFDGPIAIAPNSPPVRLLSMERALLTDRFKLQVHQETRQLPVFDLVRTRTDGRLGPRLVLSDGKCLPLPSTAAPIADLTLYCGVKRSVPGALVAKGIPMPRLALLISFLPDVQRIVRDRTGLADAFDIDLAFARDATAAQDLPPIMTALKEQLGLELKPATGPVDVIVIDHVELPAPD
jgi:uncharacterized protein (TIGR03435 family)